MTRSDYALTLRLSLEEVSALEAACLDYFVLARSRSDVVGCHTESLKTVVQKLQAVEVVS